MSKIRSFTHTVTHSSIADLGDAVRSLGVKSKELLPKPDAIQQCYNTLLSFDESVDEHVIVTTYAELWAETTKKGFGRNETSREYKKIARRASKLDPKTFDHLRSLGFSETVSRIMQTNAVMANGVMMILGVDPDDLADLWYQTYMWFKNEAPQVDDTCHPMDLFSGGLGSLGEFFA